MAATTDQPELKTATAEMPTVESREAPLLRSGSMVTPTTHPQADRPAAPPPEYTAGFNLPPAGAPTILPPPLPPIEAEPAAASLKPGGGKAPQRRRMVVLIGFLLLAVIVLLIGQFVRDDDGRRLATQPGISAVPQDVIGEPTGADPPTGNKGAVATGGPATATSTALGRVPADTTNTTPAQRPGATTGFTFVAGYSPVFGRAGTLRRFKVSVEKSLDQGNGSDFADEIDHTLGDSRSWIAGKQFRLQRVPSGAVSDFTIYLATPETSERMCDAGGLNTAGYTSCRLPGQVIINDTRWQDAVPDYDAPLATYRAYAINHEVGHQLGFGHEACPGKGRPAPVMQQQTYGLKGCVANAWPFMGGKRYSGPPID